MLLGKKWKDRDADERELILLLRRKIRSTPGGKRLGKLSMRKRLQNELMEVGDAELHAGHPLMDLEQSAREDDHELIKQTLRGYPRLVGPAMQREIDHVVGVGSSGKRQRLAVADRSVLQEGS